MARKEKANGHGTDFKREMVNGSFEQDSVVKGKSKGKISKRTHFGHQESQNMSGNQLRRRQNQKGETA